MLVVSGELHLERCVRDLKDRFAVGVGVRVSEPLVAFREGLLREDSKGREEDFKAKKDREKEKRTRHRRKREGEDDDSAPANQPSRDGDKRRAKDAEERRRKERELDDSAAQAADSERDKERGITRDTAASPQPSFDDESSHVDTASSLDPMDKATKHRHEVEEWTANKGAMLRVRCVALGEEVTKLLEEGRSIIKRMARERHREELRMSKRTDGHSSSSSQPAQSERQTDAAQPLEHPVAVFQEATDDSATDAAEAERERLVENGDDDDGDAAQDEDDLIASRCSHKYTPDTFLAALRSLFGTPSCPDLSPDDVAHIWSFGPKRYGPNLLINRTDLSPLTSFVSTPSAASSACSLLDAGRVSLFRGVENGLVNGFQLATSAGPMCEEPMMGVAFVLSHLALHAPSPSGSVISSTRSACRRSLMTHTHELRLLEAVYLVHLQCSSTELGHLYPVLARRRGRVLAEDMQEGTNLFLIKAYLPLADSFGFSSELRKATGGEAQPQLIFSHWELMPDDPFFKPRTEEDIERTGVLEEGRNVSREWIDKVRKRKGLFVQEKVVEHAEKQRTLARKK